MTTTSLDRPQTNTAKRNVMVGMFVLIGIAILAGGILAVGNIHSTFVPKITVSTSFPDVNGLQPGNNVWFSGLKVGTVSDLEFVGESQVRVSLKIDKATQRYVHKDAMAKLSSDGLIGNKIVVITSGTPGSPSIEDGDVLKTAAEPSTDDMLVMLQESNQDLQLVASDLKSISAQIASGQGLIGRLVYDEAMVENLSTTTASLAEASQNADKTTAALATYTGNLNKPGNLLHDLAHDKSMYPAIDEDDRGPRSRVRGCGRGGEEPARTAATDPTSPAGVLLNDDEAGADLKATLANLETSSQKLDEDLEAASTTSSSAGSSRRRRRRKRRPPKKRKKRPRSRQRPGAIDKGRCLRPLDEHRRGLPPCAALRDARGDGPACSSCRSGGPDRPLTSVAVRPVSTRHLPGAIGRDSTIPEGKVPPLDRPAAEPRMRRLRSATCALAGRGARGSDGRSNTQPPRLAASRSRSESSARTSVPGSTCANARNRDQDHRREGDRPSPIVRRAEGPADDALRLQSAP